MEIRFLGHSAFSLVLDSGRGLLVDPFLTSNPVAAAGPGDFPDHDLVLVTHDHDDHIGDAFAICRKQGATLVAIFETAMRAQAEGIAVEPMSVGGAVRIGDDLVVNMVNAQHGAGHGHAAGFVLESGGKVVYFAGDTALFGDMRLFAELWSIDLAVLPIGDRFTMGARHAARAVELLKPRKVVPCHYATWPLLAPNADEFVRLVGNRAEVHALAPGDSLSLA